MSRIEIPDDGGDTISGTDFGEIIAPCLVEPHVGKQIFDNIPDLEIKDDDIMLCTYIKTGTNWLFEILSMVLKKSAERDNSNSKLFTMIDTSPSERLDIRPSPRILNSHFSPKYLPRGLKTKKTRTILCIRNPKDTCVSHFNHIKPMKPYNYNGRWENFVRPWVQGKFEYGAYTSYLNQWQTAIEDRPGFPLHVVYYEDLKLNGLFELNRLLAFLDIEIDEKLKSDILEMCHIDKMKERVSIPDGFLKELIFDIGHVPEDKEGTKFTFFRKGIIGDWTNVFTVAQNEIFDEIWKRNIRSDTIFTFRYT